MKGQRITHKIKSPNLGLFNIIFKSLSGWGKFKSHYEDSCYFIKYSDLSFLDLTGDRLLHTSEFNIKTFFVDFPSFYTTSSEMYFILPHFLKLIIHM